MIPRAVCFPTRFLNLRETLVTSARWQRWGDGPLRWPPKSTFRRSAAGDAMRNQYATHDEWLWWTHKAESQYWGSVGERLSEYPETGWLYAAVLQAGRAGRIVPRLYTYIHSDNDDSVTSRDLEHPQKNMTENPEFSLSLCSSWYKSLQFAFTESFDFYTLTSHVASWPHHAAAVFPEP